MSDPDWIDEPAPQVVTICIVTKRGENLLRKASREEAVSLASVFRNRDMTERATGTLVHHAGVMVIDMDDIAFIEIPEGNERQALKLLNDIEDT